MLRLIFNYKLDRASIMEKNKIFIFLFFLISTGLLYSQKYEITTEKLNVREKADSNSNIIGSYYKNDTVTVFAKEGSWLKIKLNNRDGFINKNYAKEIKLTEEPKVEKGFKSGFKKVFSNCFIITCLVFIAYQSYTRRIVDSRYKNGYREGKISIRDYATYVIYSLIISIIVGLISGIFSWVSTF